MEGSNPIASHVLRGVVRPSLPGPSVWSTHPRYLPMTLVFYQPDHNGNNQSVTVNPNRTPWVLLMGVFTGDPVLSRLKERVLDLIPEVGWLLEQPTLHKFVSGKSLTFTVTMCLISDSEATYIPNTRIERQVTLTGSADSRETSVHVVRSGIRNRILNDDLAETLIRDFWAAWVRVVSTQTVLVE